MEKRFFKKNKFTIFMSIFFIILFILLLISKDILFSIDDEEKYGNRLNDIVKIKDSKIEEIKNKISEDERVVWVDISVSGKIINTIITVNDSLSIDDAKSIGASVIKYYDEKEVSCYEFQVFMKKDSEAENNFPIIGYKANENTEFSWTKDRDKVEVENNKE